MKRTGEQTKKINARKNYHSNNVLEFKSSVTKAKGSDLPFLNKKQLWLYTRLLENDIKKNYIYTLDSLSNEYRKHLANEKISNAKKSDYKYKKSFSTSEKIQDSDFQAARNYIYFVNKRMFEMYQNEKDNYIIHEVEFIDNLITLKDRKVK